MLKKLEFTIALSKWDEVQSAAAGEERISAAAINKQARVILTSQNQGNK